MERYEKPGRTERIFNLIFGILVARGLGLPHNVLLEVRGRNTGRRYATPVDLLIVDERRYLVAPRGHTQWVRNALASGTVTLRRGRWSERFRVRALSPEETPPILRAYLDRFRRTVQRYFPVPAGSPAETFRPLVGHYPAFELVPDQKR